MKLPTEIKGIHKLRDAMILSLWSEGFTCQEIKEMRKLPISVRRIEQILYTNKALIKVDKAWEETKQIHRIKKRIKHNENKPSLKDPIDWEYLLDNKIGDKKSGGGSSGETKIIIIRPESKADGTNSEAVTISRQISV